MDVRCAAGGAQGRTTRATRMPSGRPARVVGRGAAPSRYKLADPAPWHHTTHPVAEVANLQSWLSKHLAWLDGEFAKQAGGGATPAVAPAGR